MNETNLWLRPPSRNRKCQSVADVGTKMIMASPDQSHLDLTDKETRDKLSLWDRRTDAMAPLTEKQTDSILEIRAAAENLAIPAEVRCDSEASLLVSSNK